MKQVFINSLSETLPTGQLSSIPWRRAGVKYTNNEAYFDVVEEVDAIIDKSGSTVFGEIQGYVSDLADNFVRFFKSSTFHFFLIQGRLLHKVERNARFNVDFYESTNVGRC